MRSPAGIGWASAALLFSVCGAISSQFVNLEGWGVYLLPIPFGILSAWLFAGKGDVGLALIVVDAMVWQLAYRVAIGLGSEGTTGRKVFALCLAGLIGGLGVTLATALAKRQAPSVSGLVACALTGAVCGLPFSWWVVKGFQAPIPEWALNLLSFVIWQGAVGLSLWRTFGAGNSRAQKLPRAA